MLGFAAQVQLLLVFRYRRKSSYSYLNYYLLPQLLKHFINCTYKLNYIIYIIKLTWLELAVNAEVTLNVIILTFYKYHIVQQPFQTKEDKNLYYTMDNDLYSLTFYIHRITCLHFLLLEFGHWEYAFHNFDISDISKVQCITNILEDIEIRHKESISKFTL